MTNGNERLDRIERILEQMAQDAAEREKQLGKRLDEMAARQRYHDEAHERHDAEIKKILEAITIDAENIRALVRVAELHHERLNRLEGGEQAQ